jgi:protein-tyrosine phosphatase
MAQARDYAMAGTDCLLLEMPFSDWPPLWENIIYDLQALKLQIIIAHPERYLPIQKNYAILDSLCDVGCFFQCNVSSIVNGGIRKAGVIRYLRKTGRLDFVATDAHSVYEYRLIQRAIAKVRKEINYQTFDEILEK